MAADVYRDSRGRFSGERGATFKQSGERHFIRLFGSWAELKPVTPESLRASMQRVADAQSRAAQESAVRPGYRRVDMFFGYMDIPEDDVTNP